MKTRTQYLAQRRARRKNLKRLAFTIAIGTILLIIAHFWSQDCSGEVINLVSQPVYAEAPKTTPTPTATATPTLTPKPNPKIEVPAVEKIAYIQEVFGESEGNRAVKMLKSGENDSLGQFKTNKNRNGTIDYGVFQVNSIHIKKCGEEIITDWKANVRCAKRIYDDWQGFGAWTNGHKVGDVTYLQRMQKGK